LNLDPSIQRRLAILMNVRMRQLYRFVFDAEGATAVEYAVMLAMILMAIIASVGVIGAQTGGMWGNIQKGLQAAGFGGP
jgi:pilus assembly protein Flp/PilA